MGIVRRRYYFWLVRAYLKRWKRAILSSVLLGIVVFFLVLFALNLYILPTFQKKLRKVGYVGTYTLTNIPSEVLSDVSYGLTKADANDTITTGAAYKWEIKDNGKIYIFHIKKGQYFDDNKELTAQNLNLDFKDVKKTTLDDYTVEFSLKEPYSPFLSVVSRPIVEKNLTGLGEYKISKLELNGGFVKSITIEDKKNSQYKKIINFYSTQEALKTAYALGDIHIAIGAADTNVAGRDMEVWKNTQTQKQTDYTQLVTLFYNNSDSFLSDKKLREGLSYAVPQDFPEGERAYSPIPPSSIYFAKGPNFGVSDLTIAKSLISSDAIKKEFEITVPDEYQDVAERISQEWKKIGIKTKIKVTTGLPSTFQILIYPIKLPLDPDQYTLWHSGQINNIIGYKNLRIDKLLEDGRSTTDQERRIGIYADFQKYIVDDAPAAFLYFPYSYTLSKR